MQNEHEFLSVIEYLDVADLMQLRVTCKSWAAFLAPNAPYWRTYAARRHGLNVQYGLEYLLEHGVLHKALRNHESADYHCPFCLKKPCERLESADANERLVALCDAERCEGFARYLLDFVVPMFRAQCVEEIGKVGLDPNMYVWRTELYVLDRIVDCGKLPRIGVVFEAKAFAVWLAEERCMTEVGFRPTRRLRAFYDFIPSLADSDLSKAVVKALHAHVRPKDLQFHDIDIKKWPWQSATGDLEIVANYLTPRPPAALPRYEDAMVVVEYALTMKEIKAQWNN